MSGVVVIYKTLTEEFEDTKGVLHSSLDFVLKSIVKSDVAIPLLSN